MSENFTSKLNEYIRIFDEYLFSRLPRKNDDYPTVSESMRYAVEGGGKRIRPCICLAFADMICGDAAAALSPACALELVHSYSLVHDDMECMDNDDYRRGKLSVHKKFGEANGLLCGDALLTYAFSVLATGDLDDGKKVKCIRVLSEKAGIDGMIGGQEIDLSSEDNETQSDVLLKMDELKTSALLECACVLGIISAGRDDLCSAATDFGKNLGLAFQIVDDILDYLEGEDNSDIRDNKLTYVSAYTLDGARKMAENYTAAALKCLDEFSSKGFDTDFLRELSLSLLDRKK